jgi:hypothetical protein
VSVVDPSVAVASARSDSSSPDERPRSIARVVLGSPRGACAAAFLLAVILACALSGLIASMQDRRCTTCSAPTSSAGTSSPGCCMAAAPR